MGKDVYIPSYNLAAFKGFGGNIIYVGSWIYND